MSTLTVSNISDGTTTVGASYVTNGSAKAWLRFNQNGPTINASLNTSSVIDQATGNYYQNITNAFSSVNYSSYGSANEENNNSATNVLACDHSDSTSSQCRWWTISEDSGPASQISTTCIHGDLA